MFRLFAVFKEQPYALLFGKNQSQCKKHILRGSSSFKNVEVCQQQLFSPKLCFCVVCFQRFLIFHLHSTSPSPLTEISGSIPVVGVFKSFKRDPNVILVSTLLILKRSHKFFSDFEEVNAVCKSMSLTYITQVWT